MSRILPALSIVLVMTLSACGGPIVAVATDSHDFTVSTIPQVVVRSFNGKITVTKGTDDKVVASVKKTAHGWSEAEAVKHLDDVLFSFTEEGATVTISASERAGSVAEGGAEVTLTVPAAASIDLNTSNGDVTSSDTTGSISAVSSNGTLTLKGGQGTIHAVSSNGSIALTPLEGALISAVTSNGAITFRGSPRSGESRFETSNGSITLTLPSTAAFELDAQTSNGSVSCEFPFTSTGSTGTSLQATVGDNPSVKLTASTSNGSISVRKM